MLVVFLNDVNGFSGFIFLPTSGAGLFLPTFDAQRPVEVLPARRTRTED
ncbi:hypothetical protein I6J24_08895 [Corynebacterium kroppenstedtii]|nr:hypothetical protein [Corynebacterium pseudokroppenstedtii]MDK7146825.1 hypothetical protein [Corynebacterium pseudokroppenstedtii]QRP14188.1 hypothetical protein I6J24_08895 [Corynebacterium kroppenstedtii]